MTISPVYSWATLSAARIADIPQTGAAAPLVLAAEPAPCDPAAMTADLAASKGAANGTSLVIALHNLAATACTLPGDVAAVRANEAGQSIVGKTFTTPAVSGAAAAVQATYSSNAGLSTAAVIQPGSALDVSVLLPNPGSAACQPANSLSVFAGAIALGTSADIALPSPVTVCGNPRVLPATSHNPAVSLQLAQSTLSAIAASGAAATLGPELITANASGFTYGADSNGPTATGSGPYYEPHMPSGQSAYFGVYIGQRGTYFKFVCGSTGLQWNATDYNAAQWNSVHAEPGAAGAGAVYMMAGPGRDPAYNGTSTQAVQWGIQQAQNAISGAQAAGPLGFDYIFMDIENVVQNGWNAVWNGCGTTKKASSVAAVLDNSTFNGFRDWVWTNSSYFVGVYDAGGGGSNSWSSVFGSTTNTKVPEWTYVNETTSLSAFPSGWAVGSTTPVFFGGATTSSPCALLWQWSGGNGQLNGYGDFDQLDLNNRYSSTCHP